MGFHKLEVKDVRRIKRMLAKDDTFMTAIGREFGVSRRCIKDIRDGKQWAWVR